MLPMALQVESTVLYLPSFCVWCNNRISDLTGHRYWERITCSIKKMEYADPELAAGDEPFYYRVR
jgi:hypothetical protein